MAKTGSCLCGAVTYTLNEPPADFGACHCGMCRKWSGGVYFGATAPAGTVDFQGAENISTFASSDWAERAFCKTCGSSLYYRVTAPGDHHGTYHMGLGTLDDPGDMALTSELFIEIKPKGYSFAEKTEQITGEQLFAMFAPPE